MPPKKHKVAKVPQLASLPYMHSDEQCLEFLLHGNAVEAAIVSDEPKCLVCNKPMTNVCTPTLRRCTRCRRKRSVFKGTFFANAKIDPHTLMNFAYDWLNHATFTQLLDKYGMSPSTVTQWISFLQQLIAADLELLPPEERMIGGTAENGTPVEVQVDESKFGKRMYNVGHAVGGVWVIGGVEHGTDGRRMFAVSVENRNAQTIKALMERFVRPGTKLTTDLWKGYRPQYMADLNITHVTVNHSKNFKDPLSGACTNTIEGTWSAMRIHIPRRNRTRKCIDGALNSFVWRRMFYQNIWTRFLHALRTVRYVANEAVVPVMQPLEQPAGPIDAAVAHAHWEAEF